MTTIDDVKATLQQLAERDGNTLPSLRFKGFIRKELMQEHEFPAHAAETIAARIVVELGSEPMLDTDLKEMAKSYAQLIENLRSAYHRQGFADPVQAVVESSGSLKLKLTLS
jgi:hypothetical protein